MSRCYELDEPAADLAAVFFLAGLALFAAGAEVTASAATVAFLGACFDRAAFFAVPARFRPRGAAFDPSLTDAFSATATAASSSAGFAVFVGAAAGTGEALAFDATIPTLRR